MRFCISVYYSIISQFICVILKDLKNIPILLNIPFELEHKISQAKVSEWNNFLYLTLDSRHMNYYILFYFPINIVPVQLQRYSLNFHRVMGNSLPRSLCSHRFTHQSRPSLTWYRGRMPTLQCHIQRTRKMESATTTTTTTTIIIIRPAPQVT